MSLVRKLYRPSVTICRYCVAAVKAEPTPAPEIPVAEPAVTSPPPTPATPSLSTPSMDNTQKNYSDKIVKLVDEISLLNLLEVADLNELLKSKLNLPDVAMGVPMGGAVAGAASGEEGAEEAEEKAEKIIFTVKLTGFNPDSKVKLIKEVKGIIEGMNLVQAKKFVESAPQTIMADIPKEEAEKIKEKVEAAGGTVEID